MNAHKKKPKPLGWRSKLEPYDVTIDNPLFMPDHKADRTNPIKIKATINAAESPIGRMIVRKQISEAQGMASIEFRRLWEAMGGAGVKALDYSRDQVDGGGIAEPISIRQMDAARKLRSLREYIGTRHYDVLVKVVGEGIEVNVIGRSHREKLTLMDYLKDGLEDAATFWGMQTNSNQTVDRGRTAS